jgi:hypothetical protein
MRKSLLFLFLMFVGVLPQVAQHIILLEGDTLTIYEYRDSIRAKGMTNRWLAEQVDDGFVHSALKSIADYGDSVRIWNLYRGEETKVTKTTVVSPIGDSVVVRGGLLQQMDSYANRGFPFSCLHLTNITYDNGKVQLFYKVDPGPEIRFDTVSIQGSLPVKESIFYKLLNLQPGTTYSERKYQSIDTKIDEMEFLTGTAPSDVGFYAGKAVVYLKLQSEESNRFDAMLGLLPNTSFGGSRINGYVDLHLSNMFKSAVMMDAGWRSFGPQSQSINFQTRVPVIGRTGLGVSFSGSILRQDSSFVNSQFGASLLVRPANKMTLNLGYDRTSSISIRQDVFQGYSYDWYDITFCIACSDRMSQSRVKGLSFSLSTGFGVRETEDATDSLKINSLTFQISSSTQWRQPVGRRMLYGMHAEYRQLSNQYGILQNEQYRVGGLNTIRGFYENQFYVTGYMTLRNEWRLYIEKQSYLLAFLDGGFLGTGVSTDFYASSGIGISIFSKAGKLNLIFAQGRLFDASSSPNNLIHFGYTTQF